ncbi:MAG: DinB family protein [Bryobacteraceae bacterium]|nr:DinB family protein [Bryobacterales bacterium]MEB2361391.1 DinB family protein [Bryobacterales bacterium]NUN02749.1 DinB family protein [Bryobacteraceae bacterium]
MPDDGTLRKQLVEMLHGGHAHATFIDTVEGFPVKQAGVRPDNMPHSGWELLEHMRIAQNDILEFSRSADYISPKWPDGYWPASPAPSSEADWRKSVQLFREDLAAFEGLLQDRGQDLSQPFPWGDGQTLLREALLIIGHNSYHLGQLMLVRRALEA